MIASQGPSQIFRAHFCPVLGAVLKILRGTFGEGKVILIMPGNPNEQP